VGLFLFHYYMHQHNISKSIYKLCSIYQTKIVKVYSYYRIATRYILNGMLACILPLTKSLLKALSSGMHRL